MFAPFFGTLQHLLRQCPVGFRHLSFGVMGKDAFALSTGFRCPHRPGYSLFKNLDFAAISLPNQCVDLLSKAGSAVGHGHQDALNPQLWIDLPSYLTDGLYKFFEIFSPLIVVIFSPLCLFVQFRLGDCIIACLFKKNILLFNVQIHPNKKYYIRLHQSKTKNKG